MGDDQHSSWAEVVGKFGLGRANDSGQQLMYVMPNTVFQRVHTRRAVCISQDGRTMQHIYYIVIQRKLNDQLKNTRTGISLKLSPDHFLVVANIYIYICICQRSHMNVTKMYDVDKVCDTRQGKSFRRRSV